MNAARWVMAVVGLGVTIGLSACAQEEKVVKYNPFLANVPGAKTATPGVGERFKDYKDPSAAPEDRIMIQNPDGSVTLIARSIRHLMVHIKNCLDYEDDEVMFDQVISEQTKEQFRGEGKDPHDAVKFIKDNRVDIMQTIGRMPFGEQSPSVIIDQPARRTMVLRLTGLAAKDMRFTEFWAVMEKGNWKFLWVK